MIRKILLSAGMLVFVGAAVAGATGAFFSDSEVSTGNVLAAGDIDLGVDNTSYYNGIAQTGTNGTASTSWAVDFDIDDTEFLGDNPATIEVIENGYSLPIPRAFFKFYDLKPGDYGEDTISLHVTSNEAWLCADVTVTADDDVDCNEPENDADAENGACVEPDADVTDGDLADGINFLWWADDGDNVLEVGEQTLPAGNLGAVAVGQTVYVPLADNNVNIFAASTTLLGTNGGVETEGASEAAYIGKAFCFGTITPAPVAQDGSGNTRSPAGDNNTDEALGTPADGGYTCNGASIGNAAQTDRVQMSIGFRAVQTRNNLNYSCVPQQIINDSI